PESGLAGGQQRVLARVPAKKVRRFGVVGVGIAREPDFVQQKRGGRVGGTVQRVGQAALFLARRGDQGAPLGFEQQSPTIARAQRDHERDRALRELGNQERLRSAGRLAPGAFFGFALGHGGRGL